MKCGCSGYERLLELTSVCEDKDEPSEKEVRQDTPKVQSVGGALTEGKYSGRKITESLGNVTVRRGRRWKGQGGSAMANSLSEHV
jgi:hypothetical protein